MTLPENQHRKAADLHPISRHAGNVALNPAAIDCFLPKGAVLPSRGITLNGTEVREAFSSLDGSPLTGGLSPSPNLGQHVVAAGAFHVFAPPSSSANPPGRKRSADISVFDEFRTRDIYQVERQRFAVLDAGSTVPSPSSAGPGHAGGMSSMDSSVETVSPHRAPVADSPASASSASSEQPHLEAYVEDPSSSGGEPMDIQLEDQENVPLSADSEVPLSNPGTYALFNVGERVPLHDVALSELPVDYQQQRQWTDADASDIESDDDDGEGQGWNLADELEERIRNNADGRYDFEIYCDP